MIPLFFLQSNHMVNFWDLEWNVSTTIGWIFMEFGADIHDSLEIICYNQWLLNFHLALQSGQKKYIYTQIPVC